MKYFNLFIVSVVFYSSIASAECSDGQTNIYRRASVNARHVQGCEKVDEKKFPLKKGLGLRCTGIGFQQCGYLAQAKLDELVAQVADSSGEVAPVQQAIPAGLVMLSNGVIWVNDNIYYLGYSAVGVLTAIGAAVWYFRAPAAAAGPTLVQRLRLSSCSTERASSVGGCQ